MSKFWPLGLLAQPICVLCGAAGTPASRQRRESLDLCSECRTSLPVNNCSCGRCAAPLSGVAFSNLLCGACREHPPGFERCIAPFRYEFPLDTLLRGLKFGGKIAFGRMLGLLLADHLLASPFALPELLVPVPLHSSRLKERGYNQALEISRPLSRGMGIPVCAGVCGRARATREQTHLGAKDRRLNLRGAFEVFRRPPTKHIAIVDDVVTTGSTASELASTLKRAGVETVQVWAVARAGHTTKP